MLIFKKNPGGKIKEKVVFKFQFHVTRVPPSGWEKLKVSLVPQDTGKRTNKTTKATVEYGCCRWPDPIVETTKLFRDGHSGDYDDKFYKLVVGVRTKILGDITINLADFANSPSNSIAVPLQNCRGNTLLHAKINSLTSLRKSRELSIQDDQSSESEAEMDNISVASSTSEALTGPLQKSPPSPRGNMLSLRDTDVEPFTPKEFNGSVKELYGDPPSPSSSIGGYERRRRRLSQGSFPTIPLEPPLGRTASTSALASNLDIENPTLRAMSVRSSSFRSISPSEVEGPGPDKTVQELRMEAVTWQRRARNLSLEVLKLKQENGGTPRQSLAEKLKVDLQKARQEQEANEQRLRKEVEELQRSIKVLELELSSVKEAGVNTSMQLKKAQHSNKQLVLAIQDMEESLEEQRKEMEELSSINHKLEASVHAAKAKHESLEIQWSERLEEKENGGLQNRLENGHVEKWLQTSVEAGGVIHNKDIAKELELTDENMELVFKLNKTTQEFDKKSCDDRHEIERLKTIVDELEKKLVATEEFHQAQHSSHEKLMVRLQTLTQGLKGANSDLESQLTTSNADIQSLNGDLQRTKSLLAVAEQDQDKLTRMMDNSCTANAQLESQVAILVLQAQKNDRQMSDLLDDLNSRLLQVTELEARILQVEMLNNGLEMKMQDSEELSKSRILELESKVSTLTSSLDAAKEELENVSNQLASAKMDINRHVSDKAAMEDAAGKTKCDLEAQLSRSKNENVEISETVTRKDAEVEFLVKELEALKKQLVEEQAQGREMLKQKAVLAAMTNEYKLKWRDSDKLCGAHSRARQELDAQVGRLEGEVSRYSTANSNLEHRMRELEGRISDLTAECLKTRQQMEEDSKCSGRTISSLESETEFLKLKVEVGQTEKAALEKELLEQGKEKTALEASVIDWENISAKLKAKIGELEECCEIYRLKQQNLEVQLQSLKDTVEALEKTATERQSSIMELEGKIKAMESGHDQAIQKLKADVAELEEENAKHADKNAMLQEQICTVTTELECCRKDAELRDAQNRQEQLELEEKVLAMENECEVLKEDVRNLQVHIGVLKSDIEVRTGTQVVLERRVTELEDQLSSTVEELKLRDVQMAAVEGQNREFDAAIQRWKAANHGLEGTVEKLRGEHVAQRLALEDREEQIKNLKNLVSVLENSESMLETRIKELEEFLCRSKEAEKNLETRIQEEDVQHVEEASRLQGDLQSLASELERCNSRAEAAALQHSQEKSELEEKVLQAKAKCDALEKDGLKLERQVETLKNEIVTCTGAQAVLEKRNKELEGALAVSQSSCIGWKSKVLALESDCNLLEDEKDELEMQVADLKRQALDLATWKAIVEDRIRELEEGEQRSYAAKDVLESQVAELTSSVNSKDREREALLEAWNADKNRAIEAEQRLETAVKDGEKLHLLFQKLETITRQVSEVDETQKAPPDRMLQTAEQAYNEHDSGDEKHEIKLRDMGGKIEQSVTTFLQLTSQMKHATEEINCLRTTNRDCALKLARCEEESLCLAAENDSYISEVKGLKITVLSLEQEKLALKARIQDLETEKLKLQCRLQAQHLQGSTESEKLDFIWTRLQTLRSKLEKEKENERSVLQKIEELKKEYTQEEADVHDKLNMLETQLSCKMAEMDALRQEHEEKQAALQTRVDYLETTMERQMDAGLEQYQVEVARLQNQLAVNAQRERDLTAKLSAQEISEEEIQRLQQVNEQLKETVMRLESVPGYDHFLDKVQTLETQLAEALETNAFYSSQLQDSLACNGNAFGIEKLVLDVKLYRRKSSELQMELKDMQGRYSEMSLKFAEVVSEKEQLSFALKNLHRSPELLQKRPSF